MTQKIVTLKLTNYRGCPVLVRRVGKIFEYLVVYREQFYHAHNIIPVPFYRRMFGGTYTAKEIQEVTRITLMQAETTVDFLFENKK